VKVELVLPEIELGIYVLCMLDSSSSAESLIVDQYGITRSNPLLMIQTIYEFRFRCLLIHADNGTASWITPCKCMTIELWWLISVFTWRSQR